MTHPDSQTEDAGKKKSKTRRAWSLYRWYDRISGWSDWYQWLASALKTKAGVAALAGTAVVGTTAAAVIVHNMEPVVQERQTRGTVIFAIEGYDTAGRRGTFDVVVAKKEFLWVRGSADQLEKEGKTITGADVANEVLDSEIRAGLEDASEVIAVGTASQEGNAAEETQRARNRARRTAELVAAGIDEAVPISTLNLGQYREPCAECEAGGTNWQRPFMVIAVKEIERDANLGEALADAMTQQSKLPTPKSYSAFELERFR